MRNWLLLIAVIVLGGIAYLGWKYFQPAQLPDGFAGSNGRIEATEIDIASKLAGRVEDVLVREGDFIELDVPGRRLHLDVDDAELARRRAQWSPPPAPVRGWAKLYVDHVQQAHLGADLDFLVGGSGDDVARDSH